MMNQTYWIQNHPNYYVPSETITNENFLRINENDTTFIQFFCYLTILYMFFPLLIILFFCLWEMICAIYHSNFMKEVIEEMQEDVDRIKSYFKFEPIPLCKPPNLYDIDKLLLEMRNFVYEIDYIKYQNQNNKERISKLLNLKKLYIKANILTNKYKLKVYERFLEK